MVTKDWDDYDKRCDLWFKQLDEMVFWYYIRFYNPPNPIEKRKITLINKINEIDAFGNTLVDLLFSHYLLL